MLGCYDCATCVNRPELDLGLGGTPEEVRCLSAPCPDCSHRFFRHLHAELRVHGYPIAPERVGVDRPPRDSPLGQLMVEHGNYEDYYGSLRRTSPEEAELRPGIPRHTG